MNILRRLAAVCVASLLAGCNARPASSPEPEKPVYQPPMKSHAGGGASFDYYLLSLSWSPEYCYTHRAAAQCAAHSTFVLHGLWPEKNDGTYPENCGISPLPDNVPGIDVYPDPRLARHEWQAHGTCSGMDPATYFRTAGNAFQSVKVPADFQQMSGPVTLAPDRIAAMFAEANPGFPQGSEAVSCNNGYLVSVEICLDKNLHAMACGQGLRRCNAGTVKVPAP